MNCPVCNQTALVMSERQGIEIDYCPQCRGVWLDRGELDKIIERSATTGQAPDASRPANYTTPQPPYQGDPRAYKHDSDHDFDRGGYQGDYRKRRKRGFLGELFDFD